MASRQVRKLLQQQRDEALEKYCSSSSSSSSDAEAGEAQPFNPFSLLSEDEAGDDNGAEQEEEAAEEGASAPAAAKQQAAAPSKKGGMKKGKKTRRKGGEDEIDAALKELSLTDGAKVSLLAQVSSAQSADAPVVLVCRTSTGLPAQAFQITLQGLPTVRACLQLLVFVSRYQNVVQWCVCVCVCVSAARMSSCQQAACISSQAATQTTNFPQKASAISHTAPEVEVLNCHGRHKLAYD